MQPHLWVTMGSLTLAACAAPRGLAPDDMSAAAHEMAADRESQAAAAHERDYDPQAWRPRDCSGVSIGERRGPCWSEPRNRTAVHLAEAERRRELADAHRKASEALRRAEATACAGIPESDRDVSPLAHPGDILAVEPLRERGALRGVAVRFRNVPGLSADGLERLARCHVARNGVLGVGLGEAQCPLAVPGVGVAAVARADGLVLEIQASGDDAEEVLRRARVLAGR